eukprot:GSA25T00020682001.1
MCDSAAGLEISRQKALASNTLASARYFCRCWETVRTYFARKDQLQKFTDAGGGGSCTLT